MEDYELQQLVMKISLAHFGKPFRHEAYFNSRLRSTGGRYLLKNHNIEVNKKYLLQLGEDELIGIIKHELCHYHLHLEGRGYRHRDRDFKLLLKKVGGPRFCTKLPDARQTPRFQKILIYECTQCHCQYKRKRSMNTKKYVCGICRGSLVKKQEITLR